MMQDSVSTDNFKVPTVMRYLRVQTILENEPAFKDQLGAKDKEVSKRNGSRHFFSKKVIEVTEAIHRAGLDAHTAERGQVLRFAMGAFGMSHPNAATAPAPAAPAEPKKKVPVKTAPVPPQTNGHHKPEKEKKLASQKAVKKTRSVTVPAPMPVAIGKPVDAVSEPEPEPVLEEKSRIDTKSASYQVNTAIFTLLCAVLNLAERDGAPGSDKRIQKVESLMDDYEKVKHYPSKSA